MKKLIVLIALFSSILSQAQTSLPRLAAPNKYISAFEQVGQLVNIASTYPNVVLDTITTSSTAATTYLSTGQYNGATPALFALTGSGTMSFTISILKISGTPAGSIALQGSINGSQWGPIHDGSLLSSDTLQLSNTATAQQYTWGLGSKKFPYYRLCVICPSSTQSISFSGWYDLNKTFIYGN